MVINAITLISEDIIDKTKSFNKDNKPVLELALIELAKNGIKDNDKEIAKINYVQNSTGICDYIIQLESPNVELLMKAINLIRRIDQVHETQTHIGIVLYKK